MVFLAADNQSSFGTKNPVSNILTGSYYAVPFSDVIRLGFSNADNIVLGESDHDDYQRIWGALGQSETLTAVAESGVSNMFLELPFYRQGLVNEFQSRVASGDSVDIGDFAQRFEHEDDYEHNRSRWRFNVQDETQMFLQGTLAPLLANASQANIDVHAIDYEESLDELEARNQARRTVVATRDEILRIQANENTSDPAVAQRLERLHNQFQIEKAAYNNSRLAYYNARHDDQNLAHKVNDTAQGQKTLTMLGFVHGSRLNDFEEYLQGNSIKIDIAVSRERYAQEYSRQMDTIGKVNPDFGNDPPELVYFLDEGVLATTVNTPPELARQIEQLSSSVPTQPDNAVDQENTFGKPGYVPDVKWN